MDNDLISYEKEYRSGEVDVKTNILYSKIISGQTIEQAIEQLVNDRNEFVKSLEIIFDRLPNVTKKLYKKILFSVPKYNNLMVENPVLNDRYFWSQEDEA